MSNPSVKDLGEQALLSRLFEFCPRELVGDDAALLTVPPGQTLVVTTDMLVDGIHFSPQTTSPSDIGWRSTAANLSDLAAMGATPLGITICLGLPGDLPVSWVEQLYQGITACLQPYQTPIVGGDICRSPVTTVAITALGQVSPDRTIQRNHARAGDAIVVTGIHGASRAGLELLLHPHFGESLTPSDRQGLIQAHQRPLPRLDVIPVLQTVLNHSAAPVKIAGMDSSDGLADAILQIGRASGLGAQLERADLPLPSGITCWVSEEQAIDWALYGGEDFELVLCLPPDLAARLVERLETAAIVGQMTADPAVVMVDRTGQHPDQILTLNRGFQHF